MIRVRYGTQAIVSSGLQINASVVYFHITKENLKKS